MNKPNEGSSSLAALAVGAILIATVILVIILTGNDDDSSPDAGRISAPLTVTGDDQVRGSNDAPLTLVEYSDFQCPYCVQFHPVMMQLTDEYQGKVRWVYRHYPLPFHKEAKGAAIASEAAGRQGKFWKYSVLVSEKSQQDGTGLQEADLIRYATELGLDINKFNSDRKDAALAKKVETDIATGNALKVRGTPSLFLIDQNGSSEQIQPGTLEELKSVIDSKLSTNPATNE